MKYTEKKYSKLSRNNKIRKLVYSIKEYMRGDKNFDYMHNLFYWLNYYEKMNLSLPKTNYEWGILSNHLTQILGEDDPFLETEPFDKENSYRKTLSLILLLDNIRSPFNSGSIIRTAEALGVEKVVLSGITPCPEKNNKVKKAAKNVKIEISTVDDTLEFIVKYKEKGYNIYALEKTNNSTSINKCEIDFPAILICGNEEFGIPKEILEKCNGIYHIPMYGNKNSLNVSVATGIALFEISKYFQNQ